MSCDLSKLDDEREEKLVTKIEISRERRLVYRVTDVPKIHTSLLYGCQIAIQKIEPCVGMGIIISNLICGSEEMTSKLISTSAMMAGLCTFLQNFIGVRLPIIQGPGISMIVPMVSFMAGETCPADTTGLAGNVTANVTSGSLYAEEDQRAYKILQMASGALMGSSAIHMMLGMTGISGKLAPFFGPLTVVPALSVILLYIANIAVEFSKIHIGVAIYSGVLVLVLTAYSGHVGIPLPTWNKKDGFRWKKFPLLRTLAVLISLGSGWLLCHILTVTDAIPNDPRSPHYGARTDRPSKSLKLTSWFDVPYPGQFGPPSFHLGLFVAFCICMLTSIVDSMADYIFCSRVCGVPAPPLDALNRGLMVGGFSNILSGAFGAGQATVTYTSSIGELSLTGVASRRIFQIAGIILIIVGMVGKLGAVLATIPKPVLGGNIIVGLASAVGVALSAVNELDMKRPRNVSALGIAVAVGWAVPSWVNENKNKMATGIQEVDQIILSLMGNAMFLAGAAGCFLDNTLPGNSAKDDSPEELDNDVIDEDAERVEDVYNLPFLNTFLEGQRWAKYVPFLPTYRKMK